MVFALPCHLSRQKGVLKLSKKAYFLFFLDVWALSPKFLRRLKGELCYNLRDQLPLFCFISEVGREECSKLSKWSFLSIFSPLGLFPQVFEQLKERLILELHKMIKVLEAVCVPNCFYFVLWSRSTGRIIQSFGKWSFFNMFSRLGPFPHVFGKVKE